MSASESIEAWLIGGTGSRRAVYFYSYKSQSGRHWRVRLYDRARRVATGWGPTIGEASAEAWRALYARQRGLP